MLPPEILYLLVGLAVGALVAWFLARGQMGSGLLVAENQLRSTQATLSSTQQELRQAQTQHTEQARQIAALEADFRNVEDKLIYQKTELSVQFKALANDILEEKSQRFTEQNQLNLRQILSPLNEKIQHFEQKIEQNYREELKDKTNLLAEIRKLHDLSGRISEDANNLARALKGDTKKQGNWGELILEKVLERSGLMPEVEYRTQVVSKNITGDIIKPDVIVYLPDSKHLIIDAKVSLTAYQQYMNTEDETDKQRLLMAHLASVKGHIRLLAEKIYHTGDAFTSPDFTLLFMPIESAFSLAIQADVELFQVAWDKRIVLVSPTTLLATLRTVASIWKFEKQSKNAIEIARLSGDMYDKFEGFVQDLQKIGKQLSDSQKAYDEAMKKLTDGRGNLVRSAEKLKTLGARTTKDLPKNLLEQAEE